MISVSHEGTLQHVEKTTYVFNLQKNWGSTNEVIHVSGLVSVGTRTYQKDKFVQRSAKWHPNEGFLQSFVDQRSPAAARQAATSKHTADSLEVLHLPGTKA